MLPPRPPPAKPTPGRPPPPRRDSIQRNSTLQSNKPRRNSSKKSPVLPPRPNPGHRLYNKYTVRNNTTQHAQIVATCSYNCGGFIAIRRYTYTRSNKRIKIMSCFIVPSVCYPQLEIPHGIAEFDYNGLHTEELSFQVQPEQRVL